MRWAEACVFRRGRHVERMESKGKEIDPLPQGRYSESRSGEANLGGTW
jgi:hypothetical protein